MGVSNAMFNPLAIAAFCTEMVLMTCVFVVVM